MMNGKIQKVIGFDNKVGLRTVETGPKIINPKELKSNPVWWHRPAIPEAGSKFKDNPAI